jgi:hypothetical protein
MMTVFESDRSQKSHVETPEDDNTHAYLTEHTA